MKKILLTAALLLGLEGWCGHAQAQNFLGMIPTDSLVCRDTAGTGQVETCTTDGSITFNGSKVIAVDEPSIESMIDTLANLTSVQGFLIDIDDNNLDQLVFWDDSAGSILMATLARMTTEAAPAAGDYLLAYGAEGDLRKIDWSSLPGAAGGDSVTTNGNARTNVDLDDATPAAPTGGYNVKWQADTTAPDNVSAYVDITGAADLASPATGDSFLMYDLSTTTPKEMTFGNFLTLVPSTDTQSFTSTGSGASWSKPTGGQRECKVEVWAGGGSGGKGSAGNSGAGGGGGAYVRRDFVMSELGTTESTNIAAGGAAQAIASTVGNVGGNTTFGSAATLVTAYGGGGGGYGNATGGGGGGGGGSLGVGGAGGAGANTGGAAGEPTTSSGGSTLPGQYAGPGGAGVTASAGNIGGFAHQGGSGGGGTAGDATSVNAAGGNTVWGGAGGGAGAEDSAPGAGAGGTSSYGGSGGAGAFDANNGTPGTQPGGGGGGAETGSSGKGGDGKVLVTCW